MDRIALLEKLEARDASMSVTPIKKIEPVVRGEGKAKERGFLVNDQYTIYEPQLFSRISQLYKVPGTFLKSTDSALAQKIMKHVSAKKEQKINLITRENEVVQAFNKKLPLFPTRQLFAGVLEGLDGGFEDFALYDSSTSFVQVDLVSAKISTAPAVGDVVRGGVNVRFSEFGLSPTEVEAASFRLFCTNGMVHPEYLMKEALTAKTYFDLIDRVKAGVGKAIGIFEALIAPKFNAMVNTKIDPMQAIRRIAKEHKLNREQLDRVLAAYMLEPMETMWGVTNAFTRAANMQQTYGDTRQLRIIGGGIVQTSVSPHCPTCAAHL